MNYISSNSRTFNITGVRILTYAPEKRLEPQIALRDYNDKKEKEKNELELRKQEINAAKEKEKNELELRKQEINAAKEKAIAYAQNQPKTVYVGSLFGL